MMRNLLLPFLALLSILASIVAMGLSAMASDDVARSAEAGRLQLLVSTWFVASIATPFVAWLIGRRNARLGRLAYLPMAIIGVWSIAALSSF